MDDNPVTTPGDYSIKGKATALKQYLSGTTNDYHFQDRVKTMGDLKTAIIDKDAEAFGSSLHTYQDTYSHGEFGTGKDAPLKHMVAGSKVDKTYNNVELANDMSRSTFYQLRTFNLANSGLGDLTLTQYNAQTADLWGKIAGEVNTYNSSVNKLNTSFHSLASTSNEKLSAPKDDKKN